eukprot:6560404-Heterocapsa_arctica.AAC.1
MCRSTWPPSPRRRQRVGVVSLSTWPSAGPRRTSPGVGVRAQVHVSDPAGFATEGSTENSTRRRQTEPAS